MVFLWDHSWSRASPFYFKIKTRGFHMKTSNVSEIYWFYKKRGLRMRECEGEGPRVRLSRSLAVALSLPRTLAFSSLAFLPRCRTLAPSSSHSRILEPRVFLKPVNFRHVWGFYVKTSRFYFKIKSRGSRSRVAPTEHHDSNFMFSYRVFITCFSKTE